MNLLTFRIRCARRQLACSGGSLLTCTRKWVGTGGMGYFMVELESRVGNWEPQVPKWWRGVVNAWLNRLHACVEISILKRPMTFLFHYVTLISRNNDSGSSKRESG